MIDHSLRVALCHNITARAHLAGAEAAELMRLTKEVRDLIPEPPDLAAALAHPGGVKAATDEFLDAWKPAWEAYSLGWRGAMAARRRYWREVAAVQLLLGHRWEQAESLGVEP
ncbi:MAG: hypothetical protein EBT27_03735 [Betaproteobacteria bacterium]|nr:hypothetical protein [Betaproteobacteria bacterium]